MNDSVNLPEAAVHRGGKHPRGDVKGRSQGEEKVHTHTDTDTNEAKNDGLAGKSPHALMSKEEGPHIAINADDKKNETKKSVARCVSKNKRR
jgi:hypothetical protein